LREGVTLKIVQRKLSKTIDREGNFKFGILNGALLVAPFWLIVIWLIFRK